jgi:hypothetical protein
MGEIVRTSKLVADVEGNSPELTMGGLSHFMWILM